MIKKAKLTPAEATDLRDGDVQAARVKLSNSISSLNAKRKDLDEGPTPPPPGLTERLGEVAAELLDLADSVMHEDRMMSSKRMMESFSSSSRNKQRRPQSSDVTTDPDADHNF